MQKTLAGLIVFGWSVGLPVGADTLNGQKQVSLIDNEKGKASIRYISFFSEGLTANYEIYLNAEPFSENSCPCARFGVWKGPTNIGAMSLTPTCCDARCRPMI
ncbi:hypothetical protein [uncultured Ruegeria sp.]|uniref:hypothetical protein n=1 Tax=uncultured Ruegeria sp. TaxID=259304 RepID=UPI002639AA05|nr:hypothetical protein [uncultured Ruegeria sp.]